MNEFITVLAWAFGLIAALFIVLKVWGAIRYQLNGVRQLQDMINGVERTFPIHKEIIVLIICLAWIFTH